MSNVTKLDVKQVRDAEAGRWIARIDRELSTSERDDLGQWLNEHPQNLQAFLETAEIWDDIDAIGVLSEICPKSSVSSSNRLRFGVSMAATVLISIAAGLWISGAFTDASTSGTIGAGNMVAGYSTKVGEQATYRLSDGTTLSLNTASRVAVQYHNSNRVLYLEQGEIYVNVAHDPQRPLSVIVGDQVFQAVGTEFNLEISSDQSIELVVTDGLVVIGVLDKLPDDFDSPIELPQSSVLIAVGQEAIVRHAEETLAQIQKETIETEEIAVRLSWRTGNLVFRGETLEEAVNEIGRYTAVEFVFLDEKAKKERIAGLFKASDVDGLLAVLRENFNISYEWVGESKVVLKSE